MNSELSFCGWSSGLRYLISIGLQARGKGRKKERKKEGVDEVVTRIRFFKTSPSSSPPPRSPSQMIYVSISHVRVSEPLDSAYIRSPLTLFWQDIRSLFTILVVLGPLSHLPGCQYTLRPGETLRPGDKKTLRADTGDCPCCWFDGRTSLSSSLLSIVPSQSISINAKPASYSLRESLPSPLFPEDMALGIRENDSGFQSTLSNFVPAKTKLRLREARILVKKGKIMFSYPRLFFFGITNMIGVDSCVFKSLRQELIQTNGSTQR